MKSDGTLYDFPVRLSMTVRDSVFAFEAVGCPIVGSFGRGGTRVGWKRAVRDLVLPRRSGGAITCISHSRSGLRADHRDENQTADI